MFFSQFLCLFYLMILANTYTISKTTNNKDNSESIIDNINDDGHSERRLNKPQHRKEVPGQGIKPTTIESRTQNQHKTTKRKSDKFWRKFRMKNKNKIKSPSNDYASINLDNSDIPDGNNKVINIDLREKRSNIFETYSNNDLGEMTEEGKIDLNNERQADLKPYQKYINNTVKKITHQYTSDYNQNMNSLTAFVSGKNNTLKKSKEKGKTPHKYKKYQKTDKIQANVEDNEMATAQIEALLNEIKERAIQMVSEINPSLSDLISNTVTEATFEADPILNHSALTIKGIIYSTFGPLINMMGHRAVNSDKINELESSTISPHKIDSRSLKEDGMTIAQTIEDYLQKELKSLYNKVKDKVSKDYHNEVKHSKSTIKNISSKITKKITSETTHALNKATTRPITKKRTVARANRGYFTKSKKTQTPQTSSTVDDFILLTLYEQILTKTHEDNIRKMITMPAIRYVKKRSGDVISKRNSEALGDFKLKGDVKKLYENDVMADAYDFSTASNGPPNDDAKVVAGQATTNAIGTDTSLEGLTNKISYNDYVNGYKYYLKFQKDEANANFSNLVKYQAHRHHNVDDIGKYILNKIPQITTLKRDKRGKNKIFDDNDFDDQEVSTKTEDTWFKKHFYMFVDSGPPKKYHTSEKVTLKSPEGDVSTKKDLPSTKKVVDGDIRNNRKEDKENETPDMDSVKLKKDLYALSTDNVERKVATTIKTVSIADRKDSANGFYDLPGFKDLRKIFDISWCTPVTQKNMVHPGKHDKIVSNYIKDDLKNIKFLAEKDMDLNRAKRNTKTLVRLNDKEAKKSTINTSKEKNKSKNKYGYVDVELVPTQFVTSKNKQDSKLKKLLNIFHKNKKVDKRDNHRVQRFNPFKKIKDLFIIKADDKSIKKLSGLDYEMMTTQVTGFKPYKFDRVQSLDDMRNQIFNITEFLRGDVLEGPKIDDNKNYIKTLSVVPETNVDTFYSDGNLIDDLRDIVEKQLQAYMTSTEEDTVSDTTTTTTLPSIQTSTSSILTTKRKHTSSPVIKYKFIDNSYTDNLLSIFENTSASAIKSINTISDEDINKALERKDNLNNYERLYLQTTPSKAKEENNVKESDKGTVIGKTETNIVKFHLKPNNINEEIDVVPVLESPKNYEGFYEIHDARKVHHNNGSKGKHDSIIDLNYLAHSSPDMNKEIIHKKEIENDIKVSPAYLISASPVYERKKTVKYSDYFSDLLMRNHDILHNDDEPTLPNAVHFDDITESTPNVQEMRRELNDIEDSLMFYTIKSSDKAQVKLDELSSKYNVLHKVNNDLIHKAVNEPIGKVLIKEEAQYFRYDKLPMEVAEHYMKSLNIVNRVDDLESLHKKIPKKSDVTVKARKSMQSSANLHNRTTMRPITKINMAPQQHFATPLPMDVNNFEKFLKENNIDVASVTSPLLELPALSVDNKNNKSKTQTDKANVKAAHENSTFKTITKEIDINKKTKNSIDVGDLDDEIENLHHMHKELFKNMDTAKVKGNTKERNQGDVKEVKLFEVE